MIDTVDIEAISENMELGEKIYDDLNGEKLPTGLVREARRVERQYYRNMKVYDEVCQREAFMKTQKPPVKVRWVHVKKGTKQKL